MCDAETEKRDGNMTKRTTLHCEINAERGLHDRSVRSAVATHPKPRADMLTNAAREQGAQERAMKSRTSG